MQQSNSPSSAPKSGTQGTTQSDDVSQSLQAEHRLDRWLAAIHLLVLWSFAVAQPLYDCLSDRLRYLNDTGVEPSTLVLLTFVVSLLIPLLFLVGVEALVGLASSRARQILHLILVALLAGAAFVPVIRRIPSLSGLIVVPVAFLGGAGFAWGYRRWRLCRALLSAASPGIVVFPVWFLCGSPISTLLFPRPLPQRGPATAERPVPIVMVVMDECCGLSLMNEQREIDATFFPNFSDLSRRATWFRNATTVHPFTDSAVGVLLTGEYPRQNLRPTVAHHPVNLFTLLQKTNQYQFAVFEPYTRLFPPDKDVDIRKNVGFSQQLTTLSRDLPLAYLDRLVPAGFPIDVPKLPQEWFGFRFGAVPQEKTEGLFGYSTDTQRTEQFEHFLRCIQQRERPALYFLHIVLPHLPWVYLPSGHKYKLERQHDWSPAGGLEYLGSLWSSDEFSVAQNEQRYLLQLRYADRLIGRLIERLKEVELFDPSLMIVTADHGVCFVPNHFRRVPAEDTFGDILSVPMFIKAPNQQDGGPNDRNVQSVDVLPTILDTVGYSPALDTDGQNILDPKSPAHDHKTFYFESGGEPRTFSADFPEGKEALRRMLKTRGDLLAVPLRIGPDLVGRDVTTLPVGRGSSLTCEWRYVTDIVDDSPAALLPCLVQGSIAPAPNPDQPIVLAVAVNGTVAGVTRTYQIAEMPEQWSLLFPESFLRIGKNEFTLFEVREAGGHPTLHAVETQRLPASELQ